MFFVNRQLDCGVHGVSYGWMEPGVFERETRENNSLNILLASKYFRGHGFT